MKKYICISEKENDTRALYYSIVVGKGRIYRSSFPVPTHKDFRLFKYAIKKNAQNVCDRINKAYNDDFIPKLNK